MRRKCAAAAAARHVRQCTMSHLKLPTTGGLRPRRGGRPIFKSPDGIWSGVGRGDKKCGGEFEGDGCLGCLGCLRGAFWSSPREGYSDSSFSFSFGRLGWTFSNIPSILSFKTDTFETPPTVNDLYLHFHTVNHDMVTFIDTRSERFYAKLQRRHSS
ncbi:hypothetical protein Scep_013197 [Stephania cephalantha]|uniref:Uncharacterized protein n=1 Tax=Stephania cephalantha TaxID=152367 RepID=A0AAP0JGX9_9MAGN